jgi:succinoglycan biosynthesis protein ExoM
MKDLMNSDSASLGSSPSPPASKTVEIPGNSARPATPAGKSKPHETPQNLPRNVRGAFPDVHLVTIGVCTSGRPLMLEACLRSLAAQQLPHGVLAQIVVVHNGSERSREASQVAFDLVAVTSPIPAAFYHIPSRGIALARNIVLSKAQAGRWVAFIDDDEIADPEWLAELMAPQYRSIPVLMGRQMWVYPEPRPFWAVPEGRSRKIENEALKTAFTNNVRFSTALIRAGLRFNEDLGFMGGEDNEFFATARAQGFEIRQTLKAVTYETAHAERLSYRGQVYRAYWTGASNVRRLAVERGWGRAIVTKLASVPTNVVAGVLELAASPLFLAGGLTAFKRRALAGGKKIGKGAGRAVAMLGYMPKPYQVIVGR